MPISDRVPDDSIEVADSEEEEGDVIVFRVGGSAAAAATVSALPQPGECEGLNHRDARRC